MKIKAMSRIAIWIPAVFCGFLGGIEVAGQVMDSRDAVDPIIACFLPMCFVFMGFVNSSQHDRIEMLETRLKDCEKDLEAAEG